MCTENVRRRKWEARSRVWNELCLGQERGENRYIGSYLLKEILEKIKIWLSVGMGNKERGRLFSGYLCQQSNSHRVFTVCGGP